MAAESVTLGYQRMVEVISGMMRHAEPLHHSTGREIAPARQRHDFTQAQLAEAERQHRVCPLSSVSPAPILPAKSPSHLDAGREVRLEPGSRQPDEAGKRSHADGFHGPETPTVLLDVGLDALRQRVASSVDKRSGK